MNNPDTSETVYSPNVDLHIFHSSASIVFGPVNLGWKTKAIFKVTVSTFKLHKSC